MHHHQPSSRSSISSRKQSIVEAAEAHFDKNTIILCVNVIILIVLVSILYILATSVMNVGGGLNASLHEHRSGSSYKRTEHWLNMLFSQK